MLSFKRGEKNRGGKSFNLNTELFNFLVRRGAEAKQNSYLKIINLLLSFIRVARSKRLETKGKR